MGEFVWQYNVFWAKHAFTHFTHIPGQHGLMKNKKTEGEYLKEWGSYKSWLVRSLMFPSG